MKVLTWWAAPKIASKYDAIICDGAVRSGKTVFMSISFVVWAMKNFDKHSFAICGKTVTSCQRNVITPLLPILRGSGYNCSYVQTKNYVEIKQGGKTNIFYVFGGKDEGSASLIQGMTLAGVLLDEVALMPQSFALQALARCSVEKSKFWFNCNPENPNHWFYIEWIKKLDEKKAVYLHFTMDDNPSLSEEIKNRYKSLYSGVFYERFVLGRWVVAGGVVYPMFNKEFHLKPTVPRPYEKYYISCDYGTLNPFSIGLWGKSNDIWYRIKEYYHDGRKTKLQKTDEEYYNELEKLAGNLLISTVIVDPSAASFIACIKKHNKFRVSPAINDVINGIQNVATHLKKGDLLFNDCCKDTIKEFEVYSWDEKSTEDKPVKVNDHAMDDIRYFVNTVLDNKHTATVAKTYLGG